MKGYRAWFGWIWITALLLGMPLQVKAAGWTETSDGVRWYNTVGECARSVWKKGEDGQERWLGADGRMAQDTWVRNDEKFYYVDAEGIRFRDVWAELPPPVEERTEGDGPYWYYFGQSGRRIEERWQESDGKRRYLGKKGIRQHGWILDRMYYAGKDGVVLTGWQTLQGEDGRQHRYWFNRRGKKRVPQNGELYLVEDIEGKSFCFNQRGELQTGWVALGEDTKEKASIAGYRLYGADGAALSGWQMAFPPKALAQEEKKRKRYYLSSDGVPRAAADEKYHVSDLVKIEGERYLFGIDGTAQAGFQKLWNADESAYELYCFGKEGENTLLTGLNRITERDGKTQEYWFSLDGSGLTGVRNEKLYYKGRLQTAKREERYRAVLLTEQPEAGTKAYLVDAEGYIRRNSALRGRDGTRYRTDESGAVLKECENGRGAVQPHPAELPV